MSKKSLLVCGVVSTVVYLAMDILGSLWWEGYSYVNQTISELAALGAPSRTIAVALGTVYNILLIPFAAGVAASSSRNRLLRIAAAGFAGVAIAGIIAAFFPIQQRGEGAWTINETVHIALTMITVFCILIAMLFGAVAGGPSFFFFSMVAAAVMLMAGALAGLQGPHLVANEPTPWLGVLERISIFAFLGWVAALAIVLMRPADQPPAQYA